MTYDGYGDEPYPRYDDPFATTTTGPVRDDIESLLLLAIDMVNQAKAMPLSASILMSRDEILDVLERALQVLPEEIREARWALRDRDELMAAELRKAEQLMDRVRVEAARMVDKTEIMRQARVSAEQIVSVAEEKARTLINEAEDFCDQKLAGMSIVLDRLSKTVQSGRDRLRPSITPPPPPIRRSVDESYDDEVSSDASSFFDQDSF